jgi:hypothetical protein
MYEFFKNIAESNGFVFEYGRSDYQNLYNEEISGGTVHLFVDPITIDSSFSDVGNESQTYSGKFMLLISSDVDETYEDKYNDYIKPLINSAIQTLKDELICSEMEINKFQMMEVINLFDYNLDGVLVSYSISNND